MRLKQLVIKMLKREVFIPPISKDVRTWQQWMQFVFYRQKRTAQTVCSCHVWTALWSKLYIKLCCQQTCLWNQKAAQLSRNSLKKSSKRFIGHWWYSSLLGQMWLVLILIWNGLLESYSVKWNSRINSWLPFPSVSAKNPCPIKPVASESHY